ncbi:hypothetical protein [Oceanivirga miroungae]|uniref:Conjugal transfer protein TraD n=1 Tax=Oceanivirga miroungae TaxID=1130046 RepID=A0A6I8M4V0_9FUSO|nr:hypothetical protein [Oceanivirga miroungae]VWL84935.1 hypothetical protein OMES3154_00208 [Oceanivirga miroungae]
MNKNLEKLYIKILKAKRKALLEKENIKKQNKKERDHALIVKGTIFERLDLMEESEEFLIGLIISSTPFNLTQEQKNKLIKIGENFIKLRNEELKK